MGCGVSKDSASDVLGNTVTQNGNANSKASLSNGTGGAAGLPGDQQLEEAATRIQAAFRGHTTRKQLKEGEGNNTTSGKMSNQEEVDIDLNDPEVAVAATKIQASFRGHKARKQQDKQKQEDEITEKLEKLNTKPEDEEDLPDLSDPEVHKAATLIQAQFKGHMVRKIKETKPDDSSSK